MGIFSKPLTAADLAAKIANFEEGTRALTSKRDAARRRLSGALARSAGGESGGDMRKLRAELGELEGEVGARPDALAALNRELRRAGRAEASARSEADAERVKKWSRDLGKAGEKIEGALVALAEAVGGWLALAGSAPAGSGPGGINLMNREAFNRALYLEALEKALPELAGGKAGAAVGALKYSLGAVQREAAGGIEQKLASLAGDERRDPEVAFESEPEPAAAAGGR